MILIKQSWVTGKVQGISYRGLLGVELNKDSLIFLIAKRIILEVPINNIQNVKQIRNIIEFGLKIRYFDNRGIQTVRFRTRKYKEWSSLFRSLGVPIIPHGGWLEIV